VPASKRELTILFCDLRGSTHLAEQLPLADFMQLIQSYHQFVTQAIVIQYGYVVQFLGDGVMAYFGYPTDYPQAAQRSICAGLELAGNIGALDCPALTKHQLQLSLRVSIHTGTVVMADLGIGNRRETLALGEAPNIAARLQSFAPENGVAVSEATYQKCKDEFAFKSLGTQQIKGLTQSMNIYQPLKKSC